MAHIINYQQYVYIHVYVCLLYGVQTSYKEDEAMPVTHLKKTYTHKVIIPFL